MLDDERLTLAVLKDQVCQVEGARGFAFTHPADALRWCAANSVGAVLIDFMMQVEFVEHFRALPAKSHTPILMVTGSRDA